MAKSSDESAWGYSGVGATGRKLTDGCWDGWNFAVNMSSQPWKEMAPAAKNGPTAPSIKIQPESIVVSPGESATFVPEFKGDTLVYQWYKNEIAIPDAKLLITQFRQLQLKMQVLTIALLRISLMKSPLIP